MPERFFLGPWRPASAAVYAGAVALLCLLLAVIGWRITDQTNPDANQFDQSAYVLMARQMASSWYPWYTDGTRNPLLPWLAARCLDPEAPGFFEAGKKLNVLLGVAGTALIALVFARRMGPLAAFNATTLGALAVLLPISTFFGAEAVFYVLFLLVCLCAMRLLNENPVWLYAVLGGLGGLAWLAKPSATPFLGLFVLFSGVRFLLALFPRILLPWPLAAPAWSARRLILGGVVCALLYGSLIAPRLVFAAREWGSPTYSLPGFWFWADDWETCTRIYYDCRKETLAKLPPELQPSAAGYFRRHTVADAWERLRDGAVIRLGQFFHPEGKKVVEKPGKPRRVVLPHRGIYLGILGGLAAIMAGMAIARGRLAAVGPVALPVLLWAATFTVYVLAMGWYEPTGPGHRFIMTLYLPTLWLLFQGGEQLRCAAASRLADGVFLAVQALVGAVLVWRVLALTTGGTFDKISYAF